MLDLANLEMDSLFALHALPNKQLALFASNGTVLILHEVPAGGVKIKTTVKLLGDGNVFDDDSLKFLRVFKLSLRIGMFLCCTSEGLVTY